MGRGQMGRGQVRNLAHDRASELARAQIGLQRCADMSDESACGQAQTQVPATAERTRQASIDFGVGAPASRTPRCSPPSKT